MHAAENYYFPTSRFNVLFELCKSFPLQDNINGIWLSLLNFICCKLYTLQDLSLTGYLIIARGCNSAA